MRASQAGHLMRASKVGELFERGSVHFHVSGKFLARVRAPDHDNARASH
jgi:hypothetical protein